MRAKEFITELFDQPVEYQHDDDGITFQIGDNQYGVNFTDESIDLEQLQLIPEIQNNINLQNKVNHLFNIGDDDGGEFDEIPSIDIEFGLLTNYALDPFKSGIENTGHEFKVFSTVVRIIKDILSKAYEFNVITFTAKESSRIKLYTRMVRALTRNSEWVFAGILRTGGPAIFHVIRK